jgi:uncharacterized protein involved in propanediol utilization
VTLPCKHLLSAATYTPEYGRPLRILPRCKTKALLAAELTRAHLGVKAYGGYVVVENNIEDGKGCGSSTADCVATSHAVANAFGVEVAEETVARLVVDAEIASDSVIFKDPVLFAQREGIILEKYGDNLPALEVIGFDLGGTVDTLARVPPAYSEKNMYAFDQLLNAMRTAIPSGDLKTLGRIATRSACINNRFQPKPRFPEVCRLTKRIGGLGVSVAHSGTVMSILLDPNDSELDLRVEQLCEGLAALGIESTFQFRTNHAPQMGNMVCL